MNLCWLFLYEYSILQLLRAHISFTMDRPSPGDSDEVFILQNLSKSFDEGIGNRTPEFEISRLSLIQADIYNTSYFLYEKKYKIPVTCHNLKVTILFRKLVQLLFLNGIIEKRNCCYYNKEYDYISQVVFCSRDIFPHEIAG